MTPRFGITVPEGVRVGLWTTTEQSLARLDALTAQMGVAPASYGVWVTMRPTPPVNPERLLYGRDPALYEGIRSRGVEPVVFAETGGDFEGILAGRQNKELCDFANALPDGLIVRLNHEMNVRGLGADWQWKPPQQYIDVWRYIVDYVRWHKPGLRFLWCPGLHVDSSYDSALRYWPGADHVQVVGFDRYDTSTGPRRSLVRTWRRPITFLNELAPGLPVVVAEFGAARDKDEDPAVDDTNRSKWLATADDTDPAPDMVMYFNHDRTDAPEHGPDWTMTDRMLRVAGRIQRAAVAP